MSSGGEAKRGIDITLFFSHLTKAEFFTRTFKAFNNIKFIKNFVHRKLFIQRGIPENLFLEP